MQNDETKHPKPNPRLLRFVRFWNAGLIAFIALAALVTLVTAHREKLAAIARHEARLEVAPAGAPKAAPGGPEVRVGVYLDRIAALSVKETGWTADFYLWFAWRGDDVDPGETFKIVDGEIEDKNLLKKETQPDGSKYALYRVKASFTKFFNVTRFPADDHLLTISIEDSARTIDALHYVPDVQNSSLSSRVKLPGYTNHRYTAVVKPHAYKTTLGNPKLPQGSQAVYSQFVYSLWIVREGSTFFVKVFQGMYAAVAVAFLAFFIKPTDVDPRFGLGVGGFFGAIANGYIIASLLPDTGVMSLADTVNAIGMATIFLSLVQSAISLWLYDRCGEEQLSKRFDKASLAILAVGYIGINVAIAFVAPV